MKQALKYTFHIYLKKKLFQMKNLQKNTKVFIYLQRNELTKILTRKI